MRAHLIDPRKQTVEEIDLPDTNPDTIRKIIGMQEYTVTGMGSRVIGFCDDLGMYRKDQRYWHFSISKTMMAGPLLLISHDEEGESVGLDERVTLEDNRGMVRFIGDAQAAEQAIKIGTVKRPAVMLNGDPIWEWSPAKEGTAPNWGDRI